MSTNDTPSSYALGRFIRGRRQELGLSQEGLARAVGLSQPKVSVMEMGGFSHLPRPDVMAKLASVLAVPLADLLAVAGYRDEVGR